MGKYIIAIGIAATIGMVVSHVSAGARASLPVSVNTSSRIAQGMVGTTRNSSDTTQGIVCGLTGSTSGLHTQCMAIAANGTTAICQSTSLAIARAVAAMSGDPLIIFRWDANGNCTEVSIVSGSAYELRNS